MKNMVMNTGNGLCMELFLKSRDPIIILDKDRAFQHVNRATEEVLGFTQKDLVGKHYSEVTGLNFFDSTRRAEELCEQEVDGLFEVTYQSAAGQELSFEVNVGFYYREEDLAYIYCICRDITARKEMEKNLQQALERSQVLSHAIDYSGLGVLVYDPNLPGHPIVYANQAAERNLGYSQAELLGKTYELFHGPKTDQQMVQKVLEKLARKEPVREEIIGYRKNGEYYWNQMSVDPVFNQQGELVHWVEIQKDITEERLRQETMAEDLRIAKIVQNSLLGHPIANEQIEIQGQYLPCQSLGGDLYEWFQLDPHRYGVLVLDIMGHGVFSSLVGMSIHSLLEGILLNVVDPEGVIHELNRHMIRLFKGHLFCTGIYLLIDTFQQRVDYINAGHPPGLLLTGGQGVIQKLECNSIPIGVVPQINLRSTSVKFSPGDQLLLYTDGLIDQVKETTLQQAITDLGQLMRKSVQTGEPIAKQLGLEQLHAEQVLTDDICLVQININ